MLCQLHQVATPEHPTASANTTNQSAILSPIALKLGSLIGRCLSIKLLPILLERHNGLLPLLTDNPLRKAIGHLLILRALADEHMSRVQQRILRLISRSLIDNRLLLQVLVNGKESSTIGDGVLLERDSSRQRLDGVRNVLVVPGGVFSRPWNLTDLNPQLGVLDVSSGLVVPREEPHWRIGVFVFSGRVDIREHRLDVAGFGQVGWV